MLMAAFVVRFNSSCRRSGWGGRGREVGRREAFTLREKVTLKSFPQKVFLHFVYARWPAFCTSCEKPRKLAAKQVWEILKCNKVNKNGMLIHPRK